MFISYPFDNCISRVIIFCGYVDLFYIIPGIIKDKDDDHQFLDYTTPTASSHLH